MLHNVHQMTPRVPSGPQQNIKSNSRSDYLMPDGGGGGGSCITAAEVLLGCQLACLHVWEQTSGSPHLLRHAMKPSFLKGSIFIGTGIRVLDDGFSSEDVGVGVLRRNSPPG